MSVNVIVNGVFGVSGDGGGVAVITGGGGVVVITGVPQEPIQPPPGPVTGILVFSAVNCKVSIFFLKFSVVTLISTFPEYPAGGFISEIV